MNHDVTTDCPFCHRFTVITPAPLVEVLGRDRYGRPTHRRLPDDVGVPVYQQSSWSWWLGKCNSCGHALLVADDGVIIHPAPQPRAVNSSIPDPMNADLFEAKKCLSVGARNASVVMARRALQTAAVNLGAPKGQQLWQQIKHLADNHLITGPQKAWADAARWVGNHGAHDTEPDVKSGVVAITEVTDEDAKATVELVEHLFESLYVAPKLAEEQLKKRNKS